MIEPKPCPFCGDKRISTRYEIYDDTGMYFARCFCQACESSGALAVGGTKDEARDDAIEEWNRRAESTCHMDLTETDTHEVTYRTWECDECGQSCEEVFGSYEYCPHCGRKVVQDGD